MIQYYPKTWEKLKKKYKKNISRVNKFKTRD